MLDELIEMFESAAIEQKAAAKDKADKIASDVEKGQEMRRLSMERMKESAKRKSGSECGSGREKRKNIGVETAQYLNEKLKFDMEWRKTEQKLKAPESSSLRVASYCFACSESCCVSHYIFDTFVLYICNFSYYIFDTFRIIYLQLFVLYICNFSYIYDFLRII